MFRHLQRLSPSVFDRNPVGRLMTRITNDVDALNELFSSGSVSLVGDVLTLGTIVVILFVESWQLALIVCVVIPPLIFVTMVFQRFMRENFRAIRVRLARINANVAENIAGTQVVLLFNSAESYSNNIDDL